MNLPATQEDAERSGVGVAVQMVSHDEMAGHPASILARALSTPQRQEYDGEAVREALADVFAAWDAHVEANDRTNAAIPAIDATRAERAVYDERYRASEEAKREWYRAMHRFIENPAARAALAHPAQARDEMPAQTVDETEKLRAAAIDALSGWRYIRQVHGDLPGVGWDRVENALSAALSSDKGEDR